MLLPANISLLFFQEPTSGLDSSTALSLMQQMKSYAINFNKTIIATIHQPSSQIFHMFNNILLLIDGQVRVFQCPFIDSLLYENLIQSYPFLG